MSLEDHPTVRQTEADKRSLHAAHHRQWPANMGAMGNIRRDRGEERRVEVA
jgi:hypothetical protein